MPASMSAGSVAAKSTQVNTKLQDRHDQMEDLSRVRGLLIKLQAVFQLPKQLRAAIDQGATEIAVEKYADVAGLLKAYGHKVRTLSRWPICLYLYQHAVPKLHHRPSKQNLQEWAFLAYTCIVT